jgi:hypothetical protein
MHSFSNAAKSFGAWLQQVIKELSLSNHPLKQYQCTAQWWLGSEQGNTLEKPAPVPLLICRI